MKIDDAKLKIAKLLRLSGNDAASEQEAETALRQAEKLMQKYGIERAQIVDEGGTISYNWESGFYGFGREGKPTRKVPIWYQWLVVGIASFTDTIVDLSYTAELGSGVRFKGEAEDVVLAIWFAEYLKDCIRNATRDAQMGSSRSREDFRKAMSIRLVQRMNELHENRNRVFSNSTALVVVSQKLQSRDEYFGKANYKHGRRQVKVNPEAHAKGFAAANRVSFNSPLTSPE